MSKIKITILQLSTVWENAAANLEIIEAKMKQSEETDVFILPEMFNTGFTNNVKEQAETINGFSVNRLKEIASKINTAICGSIIIKENGKYFNSLIFIKPNGEITRYDKRHLFKIGGEAEMFTAGKKRIVVEYLGVRILLQVCYDLRFPVWSRNRNDYDVIIYVANWPASRRQIWDILLKARAIENQTYVVAVNRLGVDGNNIEYNGGSCVIDAKGEYISCAKDNMESFISASLDIDNLHEFRDEFPVSNDADRFELL